MNSEHEVAGLPRNDVGHDYGCCCPVNCEKVYGVVDEMRDAVFRDDAHDLSLCIVGSGLPSHVPEEGHQLVPLWECE